MNLVWVMCVVYVVPRTLCGLCSVCVVYVVP